MTDVFISYAKEDRAAAQRFADAFADAGLSVWWDTSLHAGEAFDLRIEAAIKTAKAVVILWSEHSVQSRWVRAEATLADRLKTLVPARIGPCDLPIMFELTHTVDLSAWRGAASDATWIAFLEDTRQLAGRRSEPDMPTAAPAQRLPSELAKPSILVLPFANMSGDPEQEYFADGVSEDIITDLGKVAALSVMSRKTAFSHKGKTLSANGAMGLGVSHMLEGSVRKSGNRVRVTAQLHDAASDTQIWAERFDRTLDDIFAIQDEISEAIVNALKVKLAPAEKQAIEQRATTSVEAYELFVMARQFSRTGSERMQPIIERICKKVVELDSDFAAAWALMAISQADMHQRAAHGPDSDGGHFAAQRAITLDANLAEGHAVMAEVLARGDNLDLKAGEPHVRRALALDSECYEANLFAGYIFLGQHRFAESIQYFEKAVELDAVAYRAAGMVIQAYTALGDTENALAAARRLLARCENLLAVEPDHAGALGFYVSALADLGETDRARAWARRAIIFHPDNPRLRYNIACAMVSIGEIDAVLELLASVVSGVGEGWLLWMDQDNSLDPIRNEPQYKSIMAEARARLSGRTADESETNRST